jgi:hypothetical protein
MKKVEIMSIAVFIVTLLIMGINMFIRPLSACESGWDCHADQCSSRRLHGCPES